MANRLANETSPYLLQHANNPVDWYPWGEEAIERAKAESKPIFLSIGYSACHWCHVMERESFEDAETAKLLNDSFVCIKVDREERPDLDQIYMAAVQVMTQHGGWPMSVFLTPELKPFYGGTYFPPEDKMGMPGFKKIVTGVANAFRTRRDEIEKSATQLVEAIESAQGADEKKFPAQPLSADLLHNAVAEIARAFDSEHGGFGSAPKFFHTMDVRLTLRHWARTGGGSAKEIVEKTLRHWAYGGIYDHLGGGFHRYSTDAKWLAPHFEKMLYDNALVTETYLEAFQALGHIEYARIARETLDYVLREMTSPEGGFFSTQDADSEGEEGKFYVWTDDEIRHCLDGDLAAIVRAVYHVTPEGNWEGKNILHRRETLDAAASRLGKDTAWLDDELAVAKRKMLADRGKRPAPFRDEKVLVSWNGLMIDTMAKAYQVLGEEPYLEAARNAARFILDRMSTGATGKGLRLLHCYKDGKARFNGYLDDYACFLNALVSLYESDFDPQWIEAAKRFATTLLEQFWDDAEPGFFFTGRDHEKLITRVKDISDGATPSGMSMAITALVRLGKLTGNTDYLDRAHRALAQMEPLLRLMPRGCGQSLIALEFIAGKSVELALLGPNLEDALGAVRSRFLPNKVVAAGTKGVELLEGRKSIGNDATLYICEKFACKTPIVGIEAIEDALDALREPRK